MRRPHLGARDRRALRVGAWVLCPALFVVVVARPFQHAYRAASSELSTQRTALARELAALRDAPRDAQLARQGRYALAQERSRLFEGDDAVAASAQLAGYVAELAAQSGVEVDDSETRAVPDSAAVAAVEIGASGNVIQVAQFLRALEHGPKLARAERIVIAPTAVAGRHTGRVTLRMSVTGLSRRAYADLTAEPLEGAERRP